MYAIGIDLGTTNSVAAHFNGKKTVVLQTRMNEPLAPSVVCFKPKQSGKPAHILTGRQAVNQAAMLPSNTIFSIKRFMGHIIDDQRVKDVKDKFPYQIGHSSSDEDDRGVRVIVEGTEYSPTDISAIILKHIKEYAEFRLDGAVSEAVITVPAYFDERQRAATLAAGKQAGLAVTQIISEPVAAAIAFGVEMDDGKGHRVVVFDLGGGTFDISIIQMAGSDYQVLHHDGDNWLGGDDFDQEIIKTIIADVKKKEGIDPGNDPEFLSRAKQAAQQAKIALSGVEEHAIIIHPAGKKEDGSSYNVDFNLTRKRFEKMILKYVDKTMGITRDALKHQNLDEDDISEILLVGGSTAIPLIQNRLKAVFPNTRIRSDINPMACVAQGASIMAHSLHNKSQDTSETDAGDGISLDDVTAKDLGIHAVKGENLGAFVPIIEKGTRFPLSAPKRQTFYTTEDNQSLIRIPVYEGVHELASQNELQGQIEWNLPGELAKNTPIEVSFNFDDNRVLMVNIRVMERDDMFHEVALTRDQHIESVGDGSQEDDNDWREETEHVIVAGEWFMQNFQPYMEEGSENKMQVLMDKLRQAQNDDRKSVGKELAHELYLIMIGGAGTASQLYLATRAAHGAPPDIAAEIQVAADNLRTAFDEENSDVVEEMKRKIKPIIARQMQSRFAQKHIEDQKDYNQLLGVDKL